MRGKSLVTSALLAGLWPAALYAQAAEEPPLSTRNLLPAGGVGLRFKASEEYGVNVRIDVAKGKGSEAFYVSVDEAF